MTTVALVTAAPAAALAPLTAWAASRGASAVDAGPSVLIAAVGAFAAGHPAVLVAFAEVPDAVLDLAAGELGAPMTAVVGTAPDGRLVLVGVTEVVPGLLSLGGADAEAAAHAVRLATEAGLSVVVVEQD